MHTWQQQYQPPDPASNRWSLPGLRTTPTDLPKSIFSEAELQSFAGRTALGRWGDPRELVGPALLLASEAGSYITGETLVVDGGTLCMTL